MTDQNKTPSESSAPALSVVASSVWLWSQAFATDHYHAIPADDHDPNATGWIAQCGAFCCGKPIDERTEELRGEACPKCLQAVRPARYGAYWLHPDGWYRLSSPNSKLSGSSPL